MQIRSGYIAVPRTLDTVSTTEKLVLFAHTTGVAIDAMVFVEQVHGSTVIDVFQGGTDTGVIGTADAMMTDVPGIALIIRTADCVPVLLVDEMKGVIAIAHAGWKGVLSGVLGAVIERMQKQYGCVSNDTRVMMGPAICGRHYDVSMVPDDRVSRFEKQFNAKDGVVVCDKEAVRLDLPQACLVQCRRFGVPTAAISLPETCTFEHEQWPSHRREGAQRQNHVWSWVCLTKPGI